MLFERKYFAFHLTTALDPKVPNLYFRVWRLEFDIFSIGWKNNKVSFSVSIGLAKK